MSTGPRHLARRLRRRLARGPVGAVWRQVRRAGSTAGTSTGTPASAPGTAPSAQPIDTAPPELDLGRYDIPADPAMAAAVLRGAFGHGYLLGSSQPSAAIPALPGFLGQWQTRRVGPLWLRTAPRTVVTVAQRAGDVDSPCVLLLGHPVDVDAGTTDAQAIADRLADLLSSPERSSPVDDAVRAAAYLAGRWTAVLSSAGRVTVLTDTLGSQPVFYRAAADGVTFGSADVLVALATGRPVEPLLGVINEEIRALRPRGVTFLPGDVTCFDGVSQVVPNCLLTFTVSQPLDARHERYWPFEPRVENEDLEEVHAEFAARLRRQLELLAGIGTVSWSLTGGLDSRVLLAHLEPATAPGTFAFTYLNPRDAATDPGAARDAFVANRVAYRLGIPHRLLRWRQAKPGSTFRRLHDATHPVRHTSHGAAHAMWADLPHDIVEVQGNGGEIGTVFRRNRTTEPLSPAKAADIWLGAAFAQHPRYVAIMGDYLVHAGLTDERLLGHSHYDILYWELRMGRWGWIKFLAGDLSHRIMPPFNDRRLLEIMLSLPEEERIAKTLYTRVLREHPALQVDDD